ncbi:Patatin-like phospholipase [Falsiroseomonas stagni DSM 19981]|uniref:Patatin-like phospholipase n=2 Tax=Falsiroseomonas TaxID=2870713 RepID=A0A1I4D448_9PROT|nr:patatin-like phospholipase family protein [Falsiroseomonas stagni]SFK87197.1 Patatin-like phospholipase [Falsiroseomonas stagni DSM 19981]
MRLSVGAVNVRTGNFAYFDSAEIPIRAEHVMASGALPPGFPAIEIDGEHSWDGGLVSNTPLLLLLLLLHAQRHTYDPRRDPVAWVDAIIAWTIRGGGGVALPAMPMEGAAD